MSTRLHIYFGGKIRWVVVVRTTLAIGLLGFWTLLGTDPMGAFRLVIAWALGLMGLWGLGHLGSWPTGHLGTLPIGLLGTWALGRHWKI
jgi:hypothetical protein